MAGRRVRLESCSSPHDEVNGCGSPMDNLRGCIHCAHRVGMKIPQVPANGHSSMFFWEFCSWYFTGDRCPIPGIHADHGDHCSFLVFVVQCMVFTAPFTAPFVYGAACSSISSSRHSVLSLWCFLVLSRSQPWNLALVKVQKGAGGRLRMNPKHALRAKHPLTFCYSSQRSKIPQCVHSSIHCPFGACGSVR